MTPIGDKMPQINFLDLTQEDFDQLEELSKELIFKLLDQYMSVLKHPDNKPELLLSIALEMSKVAQLLACKLCDEITKIDQTKPVIGGVLQVFHLSPSGIPALNLCDISATENGESKTYESSERAAPLPERGRLPKMMIGPAQKESFTASFGAEWVEENCELYAELPKGEKQ